MSYSKGQDNCLKINLRNLSRLEEKQGHPLYSKEKVNYYKGNVHKCNSTFLFKCPSEPQLLSLFHLLQHPNTSENYQQKKS